MIPSCHYNDTDYMSLDLIYGHVTVTHCNVVYCIWWWIPE